MYVAELGEGRPGGFRTRPAGAGRRFAPSPQVHKAAVHPGGACESCFAPFLSVQMAVPVWGGSGDFARMPLTRTTFRTLPPHAQGSCAPWGSVRKLFGALPARAKAPLRAARAREGRFGRFRMHAAEPSLAPTARAPINQSTCARSPRVHRCFVHLRGVCESPAAPLLSRARKSS